MIIKRTKLTRLPIIVLGLVLIIAAAIIAPVYVIADDTYNGFTYTVTDGKATITGTTNTGDIAIPSGIDGNPVTAIDDEAFKDNTSLTSVIIPNTVTSIGEDAIPDSVTIYGYSDSAVETFADSNGNTFVSVSEVAPLTVISGSGGYTNNGGEDHTKMIDGNTNTKWCGYFGTVGDSTLKPYIIFKTNVKLPIIAYSLITASDNASYTGRTWKDWTIYGANFNDDSEAVLDSPDWNVVTSVTNDTKIQDLNCTKYSFNLDNPASPYQYYMIKVQDVKNSTTYMMSEFSINGKHTIKDSTLTPSPESDFEYSISGNKATITKYIGNSAEVVIPDTLGGYPVTALADGNWDSGVFYSKRNIITSITFPDSLTKIGQFSCAECYNLRSEILIPANVTSIPDGAFRYSSVKQFSVDPSNRYFCSPDGNLYDKGQTKLIQYALGSSATTYQLPKTVTTITTQNGHPLHFVAANNCCLEEITVENGSSSFSAENGVLYNSNKTSLIVYPAGKKDSSFTIASTVTYIYQVAFRSAKFSSVVLPSGISSMDYRPFFDCRNLTDAVFLNRGSISFNYYGAFCNCNSDLKIYGYNGSGAQSHANNQSPKIPFVEITAYENGWLYNSADDGKIVGYVGDKKDITIPATVDGSAVTSVAANVFKDNEDITSVAFPSNITSIG
ncbi:MAG: leucine-rich repeat protein, partial [Ruminococcus sp.]|nr:leucine-rich repeat protein [Ruminococcus sp.]